MRFSAQVNAIKTIVKPKINGKDEQGSLTVGTVILQGAERAIVSFLLSTQT
ncbi:hypothetical protein ACLK1S_26860 [Escherichia coli]